MSPCVIWLQHYFLAAVANDHQIVDDFDSLAEGQVEPENDINGKPNSRLDVRVFSAALFEIVW